jgi:hypothetical protein
MKLNDILIIKPVLGDILGFPLLSGVYFCENRVEELKFTKTDTFFHQLPYLNRKFLEKGKAFITNIKGVKYVEEWYRLFFNWKLPDYYRGRIENLKIGNFPLNLNCIRLRNAIAKLEDKETQKIQVELKKFLFPPIKESLLKEIPDVWEDLDMFKGLKEEDIFPEEVLEELKRLEEFFKGNKSIVRGSLYLFEEGEKENAGENEIPIEEDSSIKNRTLGYIWDNLSFPILRYYLYLIKEFPQLELKLPYKKIFNKATKPFVLGEKFREELRQTSETFNKLESEIIKEFLYYSLKLTNYEFIEDKEECLIKNVKVWEILKQWVEVGRLKPILDIPMERIKEELRELWFNYKIEKINDREVYLELTRIFAGYLFSNMDKKQRLFFNKWERLNKEVITNELNMKLLYHPLEVSKAIVYYVRKEQGNPYIRSFLNAWESFLPTNLLILDVGKIEYSKIKELRCKSQNFNLNQAGEDFFRSYLDYISKAVNIEAFNNVKEIIEDVLPQGLDIYRLLLKMFS